MIKENDMVYICSPLYAPTKEEIRTNMEQARDYARLVSDVFKCRALAPHAYLPELLDDRIPWERELGLSVGMRIIERCQALIVCTKTISQGMKREIEAARRLNLPVYALLKAAPYLGVLKASDGLKEEDG